MVRTRFRATPLADVTARRVVVATTAPEHTGASIRADLAEAGAEVVAVTHALSDRPRLRADLEAAPLHDLLLTELKAAAVDVAAAVAHDAGVETMFYDNRPVAEQPGALARAFDDLLSMSDRRHGGTGPHGG